MDSFLDFELNQGSFRDHLVERELSIGNDQRLFRMGRDPKAKLPHITVHLIHAKFSIHHRPNPIILFGVSPPTGFEYGTGKDEVSVFVKFVDVGVRRKRQRMDRPQINEFLGRHPQLEEVPIILTILDFQDEQGLAGADFYWKEYE
jgi:hypothetical protein